MFFLKEKQTFLEFVFLNNAFFIFEICKVKMRAHARFPRTTGFTQASFLLVCHTLVTSLYSYGKNSMWAGGVCTKVSKILYFSVRNQDLPKSLQISLQETSSEPWGGGSLSRILSETDHQEYFSRLHSFHPSFWEVGHLFSCILDPLLSVHIFYIAISKYKLIEKKNINQIIESV